MSPTLPAMPPAAPRGAVALRTLLIVLLTCMLSQCGRTQSSGGQAGGAADGASSGAAGADSVRDRQRVQEKKRTLGATLDAIAAAKTPPAGAAEIDRLNAAGYACSRTLLAIARTMDRNDLFAAELLEEERRFAREDSTRAGKSGKTINGMLGIYSSYVLMSRMRFGHDQTRLDAIAAVEKRVAATMHPKIPAITALAAMADGVYRLSRDLVSSFSPDSGLVSGFAVIEENYRNGDKAAESDEDRFLNAVYRSFEVCQLWALLLDPANRQDISTLSRDMFGAAKQADSIEKQLTVSMDYFHRIHTLIARRMLAAAQ